ncbi:hypothetical protein Bca4012_063232 [Brassica carinata]
MKDIDESSQTDSHLDFDIRSPSKDPDHTISKRDHANSNLDNISSEVQTMIRSVQIKSN